MTEPKQEYAIAVKPTIDASVIETVLRQKAIKRVLSAFKTGTEAIAGTGALPLVTFGGGFAVAGPDTASEAFGAFLIRSFMTHVRPSSLLR